MPIKILMIKARDWYARYERPISSLSLIGGFVFDALTLKRVDLFWENLWVAGHIILVAIFIILVDLQEEESMDEKDASRKHFWYINILQFFFGGLLSTFIVFYFRSTTLAATWPFLVILTAAFIANERLKKHYARLTFQISLFFLSLLAFAIFIVPVYFHRIGTDIFLISGAISLAILLLFLAGLHSLTKEKFKQNKKMLVVSISSIYLAVNIMYFANLIPPIPLSLKEGGVYHSIYRNKSGAYTVEGEKKEKVFDYFSLYENIHAVKGEWIYAHSAIFSPTSFSTGIIHEWQRYDKKTKKWITTNRIKLSAVGGREGGYRTYSAINNLSDGEWRVNVETSGGQIIGQLRFNAAIVDAKPNLITEILK